MLLDGKTLSLKLKEELRENLNFINEKLKLVVISIGDDEASKVYINKKRLLASELGIEFLEIHYDNVTESDIIEKIISLNNDSSVTSIMVQLPLPKYLNEKRILNTINPFKDADGLSAMNLGKLVMNEDGIIPCTPKGIVKLLNEYNISLKGKNVVIVGRSNIVGKPLFNLLLNLDATVTICHSKTKNLGNYTKKADILIVATGVSKLIKKEHIKDGVIIVDVGINREDGKIVGDVDFNDVSDKVSYITPVPGGVGPLTVIMLMTNVLECYKKQNKM